MDIETSPKMSLTDLLYVIFKRKFMILIFLGVSVCAGAIRYSKVEPIYEAKAQLLVKIGRESIYMARLPGGAARPVISGNQAQQVKAEIEILKSRFLAEKVVESLGPAVIYKDRNGTGQGFLNWAVARFRENLTIEEIRDSNVINISFKHKNRRMAATAVNTLVDSFLERHLEIHKTQDPQGFFQKQYLILKDQAKLAEEKLQPCMKFIVQGYVPGHAKLLDSILCLSHLTQGLIQCGAKFSFLAEEKALFLVKSSKVVLIPEGL